MPGESVANQLAGKLIREIFSSAEEIAELHACLTSARGNYFRLRLLQAMEVALDEAAIEQFRAAAGVNEYHRHLHRLLKLGLVRVLEKEGKKQFIRTELGETAVNVLREFERRVGQPAASAIYNAAFGTNSTRLFLRIYGDQKEVDWETRQITYTPAEIGRLSLFLPRTIEGLSAIDKLNEADLLVYKEDNQVQMQPSKARSFYQYLQGLYGIITAPRKQPVNGDGSAEHNDPPVYLTE